MVWKIYDIIWPTNMSYGLYNNFQWKNLSFRPSGVQGMFKSIGLLSECIRHSRLRSSRQRSEFAKESTTPGAGGNRCPPADDLGKISIMSRYPEFKKNTRFVSNQIISDCSHSRYSSQFRTLSFLMYTLSIFTISSS